MRMRDIGWVLAALLAVAVCPASQAVSTLFWYSAGFAGAGTDLYRPSALGGGPVTVGDAYYMALFDGAPNTATWANELANRPAASAAVGDGRFFEDTVDFSAWNGKTLYTAIFTDDPGSAPAYYYYVFSNTKALSWNTSNPPPTEDTYDIGSMPDDGSGWTVIPEPATLALVGAGLAAMAWRRRRR